MDYDECAKTLLGYMIAGERKGQLVQQNVSEIARGKLAVLLFLLDEHDGVNAIDISRSFAINTSRVAAILNSLCQKKYVKRVADIHDKRKILVYLTPQGKAFAIQRRHEILNHIRFMLSQLGEKDTLEYLRIMEKVTAIVNNMED